MCVCVAAETYVIVETSWIEDELGLRVRQLHDADLGLFWLLWNQTHSDFGVGGSRLISVRDLQPFG